MSVRSSHYELMRMIARAAMFGLCITAAGCAIPPLEPREVGEGHITTTAPEAKATLAPSAIPKPIIRSAILPPPKQTAALETYTVVVNGVPVRELLFALARDAAINVDIHPQVQGDVTLNAIDQSLPQILERLSSQLSLRYQFKDDLLVIGPDTPYLRTYKIDYVNLARTTANKVNVSTQISTTSSEVSGSGGGDNNSETTLESTGSHDIWKTLTATVEAMVAPTDLASSLEGAAGANVFPQAEAGLMSVRATARQHRQVQAYLERVLNELRRQVLIEATVVEVTLSDRYQAGIDWRKLPISRGGLALAQTLIGGGGDIASGAATNIGNAVVGLVAPGFAAQYANRRDANGNPSGDLTVTASFLKEFGDVRVISSPKIMALNNQTALLKVVDNRVYFEVDTQTDTSSQGQTTTTQTTARTVAVGFVMAVTPQINSADQVTLNVRPTITRILGFKNDPNPALTITNPVPELQVREMESVLQVDSGRIAVLGGLMQDQNAKSTDGLPFLSDIPQIGEFFNYRDHNFKKTELVIFIRPWVIRTPSVVAGDLQQFERTLPERLQAVRPINSPPAMVMQP